jgi:hypothetical protein
VDRVFLDANILFSAAYRPNAGLRLIWDDAGRPEARTAEPASPAGETLEELAEDLIYYQAALNQPVLDDAMFRRATGTLFLANES